MNVLIAWYQNLHGDVSNRRLWYQSAITVDQWAAGDGWHLTIYVCQLTYSLTAADILQPFRDDTRDFASAMRGHLVTGCYWWNHPFRMVRASCGCMHLSTRS